MTSALLESILIKSRYLANNAIHLHMLTAEQERIGSVGGASVPGGALCVTYLQVAEELQGLIHEYRLSQKDAR